MRELTNHFCIFLLAATIPCAAMEGITEYTGMSDASAGVALSERLFAVANDEDNTLRVYGRDRGGEPVFAFDLNPFLKPEKKEPEADLEDACQIGDRVYWVTSHGRSRKGKKRPSRQRFFATQFEVKDGNVEIGYVGQPYSRLLDDLCEEPSFARFNLKDAAKLAPKARGALNIEGLCSTPEGHLLLGFRNPIPEEKALVVPLLNPAEMIEGEKAKIGEPVLLDLGGLGIRSLERIGNEYLIVAGPYESGGTLRLFSWAGTGAEPQPVETEPFGDLVPEAIVVYPDTGEKRIQLLSDDGSWTGRTEGGESFRGFWVDLK